MGLQRGHGASIAAARHRHSGNRPEGVAFANLERQELNDVCPIKGTSRSQRPGYRGSGGEAQAQILEKHRRFPSTPGLAVPAPGGQVSDELIGVLL